MAQGKYLIEIILKEEGKSAQPIFISANLYFEHNKALIDLLKEYKMFLCGSILKWLGPVHN